MNYDIDEMKRIIEDNIATHFVKRYSINKNDIYQTFDGIYISKY